MKRKTTRFIAFGLLLCALAGLWLVLGRTSQPVASEVTAEAAGAGAGILDGMTFTSQMGPDGKPSDVEDFLVFQDGQFLSIECQRRCGYPARPYYVRQLADGGIAFVSETHCAKKNSTIVWRGVIQDGKVSGSYHWTAERWYWTVSGDFWFEGTLTDQPVPLASAK